MKQMATPLAVASVVCNLALVAVLAATHRDLGARVDAMVTEMVKLKADRSGAAARLHTIEVKQAQTESLGKRVERLEATCEDQNARRRTQRDGGPEVAQILTIQAVSRTCPATSGRPDLSQCGNPDFQRCNTAACAGHRRLQTEAQPCSAATLPARTAAITAACCSGPGDNCPRGSPRACSATCAATFLPWWDDCEVALGKDGRMFEPTVQLCEEATGTGVSLAMQLGVECTTGVSDEACVPDCTLELHGYLLLLNIDGNDSKLSCELHRGFYSWVGAAVRALHPSLCSAFALLEPSLYSVFVLLLSCARVLTRSRLPYRRRMVGTSARTLRPSIRPSFPVPQECSF
eukprot:COSAG06_NODE_5342_length_3537_cov_39.550055_5_plen_347_part_00